MPKQKLWNGEKRKEASKFNLIQDGIGVLKVAKLEGSFSWGGWPKLGIQNSPPLHVG